ncbi:MAG: hypothetical protein ACOZQL_09850 [Myxococcota bacterium]
MRWVVMVMTGVLVGCTPVIEPLPSLETCRLGPLGPLAPQSVSLQFGQRTERGFLPLVAFAPVEVSLVPAGTSARWYAMLSARARYDGSGDTACWRLDPAVGDGLLDERTGLVAHRAADGWWTVERAPVLFDEDDSPGGSGSSAVVSATGVGTGGDVAVRLVGSPVRVRLVNHEGFLSEPGSTPAVPPVVHLDVRLEQPSLLPGERQGVTVTLGGELAIVEGVPVVVAAPMDVQVTFDEGFPMRRGVLEVSPTAPPGLRELTFTLPTAAGDFVVTRFLDVLPVPEPTVLIRPPEGPLTSQTEVVDVPLRLIPIGGFAGHVVLKAVAGDATEVSFTPAELDLTASAEVVARVRVRGGGFANVRVFAVSGRARWESSFQVTTSGGAFLFGAGRERRLVEPNQPLDWPLMRSTGLTLDAPLMPPGCAALRVAEGLRITCDASFRGAASFTARATSSSGATASTELRLISVGDARRLAHGRSADLLEAPSGALSALVRAEGSRRFLVQDGGVTELDAASQEQFLLEGVDGGVVERAGGALVVDGQAVLADARGPVVTASDLDGTRWIATWDSAQSPRLVERRPGATTWAEHTFPGVADVTDLSLAARRGVVALAVANSGAAHVHLRTAGSWTLLPPLPGAGVPAKRSRPQERLVAVALDAAEVPVVALIGADEQVSVLRFAGPGWAQVALLAPERGRLPLELSLAANAAGVLALAWTEGSHALVVSPELRVQPTHLASAAVRWGLLASGGGFVELPRPMLDPERGAPEQPAVLVRGSGAPVLAWSEDGALVLRE